jgi:hypothetical protein
MIKNKIKYNTHRLLMTKIMLIICFIMVESTLMAGDLTAYRDTLG